MGGLSLRDGFSVARSLAIGGSALSGNIRTIAVALYEEVTEP
jgi:hypothetical protein